jgi:hypothetical protein
MTTVGTSNMKHKNLIFAVIEGNNGKISYLHKNVSNRQGNIATEYRKQLALRGRVSKYDTK